MGASGRTIPGPWRQVWELKAAHFQTQATTSATPHKPGIPVNSGGQSPMWTWPPPNSSEHTGHLLLHTQELSCPAWAPQPGGTCLGDGGVCVVSLCGQLWALHQLSPRCCLPLLSLHFYPQDCRAPALL